MKTNITLSIVAVIGLLAGNAYAKPQHGAASKARAHNTAHKVEASKRQVDTKRENILDKNNNGYVGRKESTEARKNYIENRSEVDKHWEERADKNDDGVVGKNEAARAWHHRKFHVNTALEKRYDADGNGYITTNEARSLLQAKRALVISKGQAKVDSEIEREYDTNGDGILTKQEAQAMPE
jgi:EF hand